MPPAPPAPPAVEEVVVVELVVVVVEDVPPAPPLPLVVVDVVVAASLVDACGSKASQSWEQAMGAHSPRTRQKSSEPAGLVLKAKDVASTVRYEGITRP